MIKKQEMKRWKYEIDSDENILLFYVNSQSKTIHKIKELYNNNKVSTESVK